VLIGIGDGGGGRIVPGLRDVVTIRLVSRVAFQVVRRFFVPHRRNTPVCGEASVLARKGDHPGLAVASFWVSFLAASRFVV
jgi:hypothetical protein